MKMNAREITERREDLEAMFPDIFSFTVITADSGDYRLWLCSYCGSAVRNCGVHYLWHKQQAEAKA
jgi:hypothetical protein